MHKRATRIAEAVHKELVNSIRHNLSDDLLKPEYLGQPFPAGHCYVATEALYHLLGGRESGYTPVRLRMPDGVVHWWLRGPNGEVIDPTHDQYADVPYDQGRPGGFLTRGPSKRAVELMRRVQNPMEVAQENLRKWDEEHGVWNRDLHVYQKSTSTAKVKGFEDGVEEELAKFWHEHPDLRAECKRKYGYDPIEDALDYWHHGIGDQEPEHHEIKQGIEANDGVWTMPLAKQWEEQELAAAKKEAALPVNPVNYEYIPLTDYELNLRDQDEAQGWGRRASKLNRYARDKGATGKVSGAELYALVQRYENNCAYCGRTMSWGIQNDPMGGSFDHNIPLTQGGTNTVNNILPVHQKCNYEIDQWDNRLRPDIYAPINKVHNWRIVPSEFNPRSPLKGYEQQRHVSAFDWEHPETGADKGDWLPAQSPESESIAYGYVDGQLYINPNGYHGMIAQHLESLGYSKQDMKKGFWGYFSPSLGDFQHTDMFNKGYHHQFNEDKFDPREHLPTAINVRTASAAKIVYVEMLYGTHGDGLPFIYIPEHDTVYMGEESGFHMELIRNNPDLYSFIRDTEYVGGTGYLSGRVDPDGKIIFFDFAGDVYTPEMEKLVMETLQQHWNEITELPGMAYPADSTYLQPGAQGIQRQLHSAYVYPEDAAKYGMGLERGKTYAMIWKENLPAQDVTFKGMYMVYGDPLYAVFWKDGDYQKVMRVVYDHFVWMMENHMIVPVGSGQTLNYLPWSEEEQQYYREGATNYGFEFIRGRFPFVPGSFGFVNGKLYVTDGHHPDIVASMYPGLRWSQARDKLKEDVGTGKAVFGYTTDAQPDDNRHISVVPGLWAYFGSGNMKELTNESDEVTKQEAIEALRQHSEKVRQVLLEQDIDTKVAGTQPIELMVWREYADFLYTMRMRKRFAFAYQDGTMYVGNRHADIMKAMKLEGLNLSQNVVFGWFDPGHNAGGQYVGDYEIYTDYGLQDESALPDFEQFAKQYPPEKVLQYFNGGKTASVTEVETTDEGDRMHIAPAIFYDRGTGKIYISSTPSTHAQLADSLGYSLATSDADYRRAWLKHWPPVAGQVEVDHLASAFGLTPEELDQVQQAIQAWYDAKAKEVRPINENEKFFNWKGEEYSYEQRGNVQAYGQYIDGQLAGSVLFEPRQDSIYLVSAYVRPEYRNGGIFKNLMTLITNQHPNVPLTGQFREEGSIMRGIADRYNEMIGVPYEHEVYDDPHSRVAFKYPPPGYDDIQPEQCPFIYDPGLDSIHWGEWGGSHADIENWPTTVRSLIFGRMYDDGLVWIYNDNLPPEEEERIKDIARNSKVAASGLPKTQVLEDYSDPNVGIEHGRPWIYDDQNDTIYVGKEGGFHAGLIKAAMPEVKRKSGRWWEDLANALAGRVYVEGGAVTVDEYSYGIDRTEEEWERAKLALEQAFGNHDQITTPDVSRVAPKMSARMNERWDEHHDAVPFVWIDGRYWIGDEGSQHADFKFGDPELYELFKSRREEADSRMWGLDKIPDVYFGRIFPDGEVVTWNDEPLPPEVAEQLRQNTHFAKTALHADLPAQVPSQSPMQQPGIVQQAPGWQMEGVPGVTFQNAPMVFDYRNYLHNINAATISLNSATIYSGHVAVWVGVNNSLGKWIQAGISMVPGSTEGRLYFETGKNWQYETSLQDLGAVALGEQVTVKVLRKRNSVWLEINGERYGPVSLMGKLDMAASGEDMHAKGMPNQYSFSINPLRQAKTAIVHEVQGVDAKSNGGETPIVWDPHRPDDVWIGQPWSHHWPLIKEMFGTEAINAWRHCSLGVVKPSGEIDWYSDWSGTPTPPKIIDQELLQYMAASDDRANERQATTNWEIREITTPRPDSDGTFSWLAIDGVVYIAVDGSHHGSIMTQLVGLDHDLWSKQDERITALGWIDQYGYIHFDNSAEDLDDQEEIERVLDQWTEDQRYSSIAKTAANFVTSFIYQDGKFYAGDFHPDLIRDNNLDLSIPWTAGWIAESSGRPKKYYVEFTSVEARGLHHELDAEALQALQDYYPDIEDVDPHTLGSSKASRHREAANWMVNQDIPVIELVNGEIMKGEPGEIHYDLVRQNHLTRADISRVGYISQIENDRHLVQWFNPEEYGSSALWEHTASTFHTRDNPDPYEFIFVYDPENDHFTIGSRNWTHLRYWPHSEHPVAGGVNSISGIWTYGMSDPEYSVMAEQKMDELLPRLRVALENREGSILKTGDVHDRRRGIFIATPTATFIAPMDMQHVQLERWAVENGYKDDLHPDLPSGGFMPDDHLYGWWETDGVPEGVGDQTKFDQAQRAMDEAEGEELPLRIPAEGGSLTPTQGKTDVPTVTPPKLYSHLKHLSPDPAPYSTFPLQSQGFTHNLNDYTTHIYTGINRLRAFSNSTVDNTPPSLVHDSSTPSRNQAKSLVSPPRAEQYPRTNTPGATYPHQTSPSRVPPTPLIEHLSANEAISRPQDRQLSSSEPMYEGRAQELLKERLKEVALIKTAVRVDGTPENNPDLHDQSFVYQGGVLYLGNAAAFETHPVIFRRQSLDKNTPFIAGWVNVASKRIHFYSVEMSEDHAGSYDSSLAKEILPTLKALWPGFGIYADSSPWAAVKEHYRMAGASYQIHLLPTANDFNWEGRPRIAWVADKATGQVYVGPGWLHPKIMREMGITNTPGYGATDARNTDNISAGMYHDGEMRWHYDGSNITPEDIAGIEEALLSGGLDNIQHVSASIREIEVPTSGMHPYGDIPFVYSRKLNTVWMASDSGRHVEIFTWIRDNMPIEFAAMTEGPLNNDIIRGELIPSGADGAGIDGEYGDIDFFSTSGQRLIMDEVPPELVQWAREHFNGFIKGRPHEAATKIPVVIPHTFSDEENTNYPDTRGDEENYRPFVYDPENNELHVGSFGSYHGQLMNAMGIKGYGDPRARDLITGVHHLLTDKVIWAWGEAHPQWDRLIRRVKANVQGQNNVSTQNENSVQKLLVQGGIGKPNIIVLDTPSRVGQENSYPWLYMPNTNEIFIGSISSSHPQLMHEIGMENWDRQDLLDSGLYAGEIWPNGKAVVYYGPNTDDPSDERELRAYLQEWKSKTAATTVQVTQEPIQGARGIPIIYDHNTDTLYYGIYGGYHRDLIKQITGVEKDSDMLKAKQGLSAGIANNGKIFWYTGVPQEVSDFAENFFYPQHEGRVLDADYITA